MLEKTIRTNDSEKYFILKDKNEQERQQALKS